MIDSGFRIIWWTIQISEGVVHREAQIANYPDVIWRPDIRINLGFWVTVHLPLP